MSLLPCFDRLSVAPSHAPDRKAARAAGGSRPSAAAERDDRRPPRSTRSSPGRRCGPWAPVAPHGALRPRSTTTARSTTMDSRPPGSRARRRRRGRSLAAATAACSGSARPRLRSILSSGPGAVTYAPTRRSVAGDLPGHARLRGTPEDGDLVARHARGDRAQVRQRLVLPEPGADARRPWADRTSTAFSHLDTREDAPHIDEMALETFCGPATRLDISALRSARVLRRGAARIAPWPVPGRTAARRHPPAAHRHLGAPRRHRESTRPSIPALDASARRLARRARGQELRVDS